ncbi:hypothetical protein EJ05DRAFT_496010 [Pseudovirgaria hyperparasitica]|uniref:Uncharacterized protein n=1 Tax=Pseudovirgaria hyperparasitica TaxID=470096 RepID=A0A6A6WLZ0_9PEZI|nr:uncharacterized protein EJ05DRAFT_496010 [Pseudovirgaria hyperparasitica]KAF2763183.1 hypothetical protein EJ05DRAFT_496010 [Pseudovirgaria hyperparasitica]
MHFSHALITIVASTCVVSAYPGLHENTVVAVEGRGIDDTATGPRYSPLVVNGDELHTSKDIETGKVVCTTNLHDVDKGGNLQSAKDQQIQWVEQGRGSTEIEFNIGRTTMEVGQAGDLISYVTNRGGKQTAHVDDIRWMHFYIDRDCTSKGQVGYYWVPKWKVWYGWGYLERQPFFGVPANHF